MIDRIAKAGINSETPTELIGKIKFSNLSGAFLAIACAITAPIFYLFQLEELGLFLAPVTLGYISVVLFNNSGFFGVARAVLLFDFIFGAFYYSSRLGPDYSIQFLLIVGVVGIQVLFTSSEGLWRNILTTGTAILWVIFQSKDFNPIPALVIKTPSPLIISILILAVGFCVFASIMLAFHLRRQEEDNLKEALFIAEHDDLTYFGTQFYLKNQNNLRREHIDYCLLIIEIHGLKKINEQHGWDFANEVIKGFANAMRSAFPSDCKLLRLNGTHFGAWAPTQVLEEHLRQSLDYLVHELENSSFPKLKLSVGSANTYEDTDVIELLNIAQSRLEVLEIPSNQSEF